MSTGRIDGRCRHSASNADSFQRRETRATAASVGVSRDAMTVAKTSGVFKASETAIAGKWFGRDLVLCWVVDCGWLGRKDNA